MRQVLKRVQEYPVGQNLYVQHTFSHELSKGNTLGSNPTYLSTFWMLDVFSPQIH